jgi:YidC/Oxa1 family membrane protein insertase
MPDILHFLSYDILYKPLYNALMFFYTISPGRDMGLAVIFLTIFIRILLLPFSIRAARSEHRLERLEPVFGEIKQRYKYNIEKQREATKLLLRKNHIGIFSNLISLVFQILVFLVLYRIFSSGLQLSDVNVLYKFMPDPGLIEANFFNRFSLLIPHMGASLFAAGMIFFLQGIRRVRNMAEASTLDRFMLFALPLAIFFGTIALPAGKAVFIATSVCFSVWIRFVKWIVVRFFLKDEKLKASINDLWTS